MRRRVGLAQAMLGDPDLLVLDEPTVGLDPEQRLRFREMISQAGEGRTVVMSSHQTEDITALCARIAVIHQGRARFAGTPTELTAQAEGRVWTDTRRSPAALAAWRTGDGVYRNVGDPPAGADLIPPTLEDAYLLLMGEPELEGTHS
jgi:ABC-2 type transport system ATP-binding protein